MAGDNFIWTPNPSSSNPAGGWDDTVQWNDTTTNMDPAAAVPGVNDSAEIDGGIGGASIVSVDAGGNDQVGALTINGAAAPSGTVSLTGLLVAGTLYENGQLNLNGALTGVTGGVVTGTITVAAGGQFLASSLLVEGASITATDAGSLVDLGNGPSLDGAQVTALNGAAVVFDSVAVPGAALNQAFGPVSQLTVDGSSTFEVGNAGLATAGEFVIDAGQQVLGSYQISAPVFINAGFINYNAAVAGDFEVNGTGGPLGQVINSGSISYGFIGADQITNTATGFLGGAVNVAGQYSIYVNNTSGVAADQLFVNAGSIGNWADSSDTDTITVIDNSAGWASANSGTGNFGELLNSGFIEVDGALNVQADVVGKGGEIDLAYNAGSLTTLAVQGAIDSGNTIDMFGNNVLQVQTVDGLNDGSALSQIGAAIVGFDNSSQIQVEGTATGTSWQANGDGTGTLTVLNGGATVAQFTLAGDYSQAQFDVAPAGGGFTAITVSGDTPPTVLGPQTTSYAIDGSTGPDAFANNIGVMDFAPGAQIFSAKVAITGGFAAGDQLNFTNTPTITGSYDAVTGVLTVSGADTPDNYNNFLLGVTYSSSAADPTLGGTDLSRAITVSASDGTVNSGNVVETVKLVSPNGAPTFVVAAGPILTQQGVATNLGVTLTENPLNADTTVTVTVSDSGGVLNDSSAAVTGGSGTSTLTITDKLSAINADLASLTDTVGGVGPDTVSLSVVDGFYATGTGSVSLNVTGTPTFAAVGPVGTDVGLATAIAGESLSEVNPAVGGSFSVELTDTTGTLSATAGAGAAVVTNSGSSDVTITGSLADVNAALATLSDTVGGVGADTITLTASNYSAGATLLGTGTGSITVNANSQPAFAATAPVQTDAGVATGGLGVQLAPVLGDTTGETFTAEVMDTNGLLTATQGGGAAVVSNSGSGDVTISGSLADVNAALATLGDTVTNPGSDVLSLSVTDSLGGSGSGSQTDYANGQPTFSAVGPVHTDAGVATGIGGVTVNQVLNGLGATGETLTVELTDTNGTLSVNKAGGTAVVSGSNSSDVTITGTLAAVQTALGTLKDTVTAQGTDTIGLSVVDNYGGTGSGSIAVTANGAPTITAPSPVQTAGGKATALNGISVAEGGYDPASGETFTVTVADTKGVLSVTPASGVSGNGTTKVTLTGSLAQVNADLASLTDNLATGTDTINLSVTDSYGGTGHASQQVTANGAPILTATTPVHGEAGIAAALTGVSLSESGNTTGETFTVSVTDAGGALNATGAAGNGTHGLTISGTLAQVNAALATLSDVGANAGADTVGLAVTDSLGGSGSASVTLNLNGAPTLTGVPASAPAVVGKPVALGGVQVSESGSTVGETFTVTVTDAGGVLKDTGAANTISGSGTASVTISGTLAQVNGDLANLTDTPAAGGTDTVSFAVSDSFGGTGSASTTLNVAGLPTFTAPASAQVEAGVATKIAGIQVNEVGATGTFKVTATDNVGTLSASGAGVVLVNSHNLTITGTLAQVNAALATLSDKESVGGADTINLSVVDGNGSTASAKVAVNANGPLTLADPASLRGAVGVATAIGGVSLSETGTTTGETFTITVTDAAGALNATGATGNGTGALSITGTLAQVNAALATLTDTAKAYGSGSETVSYHATDSLGGAASGTTTLNVNGAPVLSGIPASLSGAQGVATAIATVKVAEASNNANAGETFTVTVGDAGGALTATGAAGSISGSGTSSLVITGSLATVNADLATLKDTPAAGGADTVSFGVKDSLGGMTSGSTTLNVLGLPGITAPASVQTEDNVATTFPGIAVTEAGAAAGAIFKVAVTDSVGTLTAHGAGAVNAGAHAVNITGTLAQVNADLALLTDTFTPAGATDTLKLTVTDAANKTASAQVAVTANGLPTLTAPASAHGLAGQATALAGVSVAEVGNTTGESFTVTVTDAGGALNATGAAGNGTGAVTISGSLAQVNAALASLSDTAKAGGSDTVSYAVKDSLGGTATGSTTLAVTGAPSLTVPASVKTSAGVATAIAGVSLAEVGAVAGETYTVKVSDTTGALSATGAAGNGSNALTISGTLAQVNAALATLKDTLASGGADTIQYAVTDSLGQMGSASTAFAAPDMLTLITPASEKASPGVNMAVGGVSLAVKGGIAGETFNVTVADKTGGLFASNAGGATVVGAGTTNVTISGSLAQVNAALASLTDTPVGAAGDTITLTATDSLGAVAGPNTIAVVTPLAVANPGAAQTYQFGSAPVAVIPAATVVDGQSPTIKSATVQIQGGFSFGDTLNFTGQNGISGSYNATSGVLTLTGTASVAAYQAALDSVTYSTNSYNAGGAPSRAVSFFVNDGTSTSNIATATLNVVAPANNVYTILPGTVKIVGGSGNDTFVVTAGSLASGQSLDGGAGTNTLQLSGGGAFNLNAPGYFANVQDVTLQEGQAASGGIASTYQTVTLRAGQNAAVTVLSGVATPGNANPVGITINGNAIDTSTITLGGGLDIVNIGNEFEKIVGTGGTAQLNASGQATQALITATGGSTTLNISGGGSLALNPQDTGLTTVNLAGGGSAYTLNLNGLGHVTVNDNTATADTITNAAGSDMIYAGSGGMRVVTDGNNGGVGFVGGAGTNVLELTGGGTAVLNAADKNLNVQLDTSTTLTLNSQPISVQGTGGFDTVNATAANIVAGVSLKGGNLGSTLNINGGGVVNFGALSGLSYFSAINLDEGGVPSETVTLRTGMNTQVNVVQTSGAGAITINGVAGDTSRIALSTGIDTVNLGSASESVIGGGGTAIINATAATAGAQIQAAGGTTTLSLSGGGAVSLNQSDSGITEVDLKASAGAWGFTPGGVAGLTIKDLSATADTITGSANGTIYAGSGGNTITGANGDAIYAGAGADTFAFHAGFGNQTINGFAATGAGHDTLQFDKSLFADWAHLLGATTQQGSDTIITLDANDSITLKNVTASSLQGDVKFV